VTSETHEDAAAEVWDEADDLPPRRRLPRWTTVLVALLTLVAAGLAATLATAYLDLRTLRESDAAGAGALAAARSYAPDLLSYDYRSIRDDLARARGHTTGGLTGYYRQLEATLVPAVTRQRAVQQVAVLGAAVESATPDRVQVVILLNRTTTMTLPAEKSPRQQVIQGRARFVLVRRGEGWLVADLSTLLGNAPPA
jgi:Mce-associated membrane protein